MNDRAFAHFSLGSRLAVAGGLSEQLHLRQWRASQRHKSRKQQTWKHTAHRTASVLLLCLSSTVKPNFFYCSLTGQISQPNLLHTHQEQLNGSKHV